MKKVVEKVHKFRVFKITNILAVCFLVYVIYKIAEQQVVLDKYNSQIETYETQISQKKDELELYTVDRENETSDEYIEKVARESLGLIKPYEKIYIDVSK